MSGVLAGLRFIIRVRKRARKLHQEILGKAPKKVRAATKGGYRNKVGKYPCGILEQAYRQVREEQAAWSASPTPSHRAAEADAPEWA
jgi:hypothetical protein